MICEICDAKELDHMNEAITECAECSRQICEDHRSEDDRNGIRGFDSLEGALDYSQAGWKNFKITVTIEEIK